MAQKTPLPALTVMYADRWNSTWFVDLENFRTQLMEDYHLRFLLTGFLRLKKQWLYLLSIHKSGGFYFFQVITLNTACQSKYHPLLEPTDENKKKLFNINRLVKKNKLFQNEEFDILKRPHLPHWKKRMSYKKALLWSNLNNKSVILKHGYYAHLDKKNLLKMKKQTGHFFTNFTSFQEWLKLHRNKIALTYYDPCLVKFFYKPKTTFNLLYTQKTQKHTMDPQNIRLFLKQKAMQNTLAKKENGKDNPTGPQPFNKPFRHKNRNHKFKRQFATMALAVTNNKGRTKKAVNSKKVLLKDLYKKKVLTKSFAYRLPNSLIKKHVSFYKMIFRTASYFYKRMFRYKKFPTIKLGFRAFYKKYGNNLKYTHLLRRLGNSMLFICRALNRVTAMQNYVYYLPMNWLRANYRFLKKAVVFERFSYQKTLVPSLALLHLAMSRGSANLIIDLLVRKLRRAFFHASFLSAVEHICRFFMAPYESNTPFKYSLCKGMEIIFKGKVNGKDRSSTWRFKFGPVHTATFYTNTREQVSKCVTRYGVFNIRVRLKLGAIINE
jgi:hypothetical protein